MSWIMQSKYRGEKSVSERIIYSSESVFWLVFLKVLFIVVDKGKSGASATSELSLEAKNADILDICFVLLCQHFSQFVLWNAWDVRMNGIDDLHC